MARRNKRRRDLSTPTRSLTVRLLPRARPLVSTPLTARVLSQVEDRRRYYPGLIRPAVAVPRSSSRLVLSSRKPYAQTKATVVFKAPPRVALCVRRQRRKEVIFAMGVAGSRVRRPRRNEFSEVSCKR